MVLTDLFGMPLIFFIVQLPVLLLAVYLGGLSSVKPYQLLAICGLVMLGSAVVAQIVFAAFYLGSPSFTDHLEPNTAIVAWLYAQGGQIYHALDAPERYAFLYGPVPYIVTGWLYELLGASPLSAKLAGFICMLVAMLALGSAVRRLFPQRWFPVVVALGYMAVLALFFKNHSFWSKPDPFMIACVAIAVYAATLQTGRAAWVIVALALGVAVNAKRTGAVYFLPILAWFYARDGWRAILLIALVSAVLAIAPFLAPQHVSLVNYISWLQAAGAHGISKQLFIMNSLHLLFASIPLGFFLLWQQAMPGIRNFVAAHRLVTVATLLSVVLILIAASKPGSGPHHFLPFYPYLALLAACAVNQVYFYRPASNWTTYGFWVPVSAFLIAATVKSAIALYYGINVVRYQWQQETIVDELAAIMEIHPGRNIYMGYGDGSTYTITFLRYQLAYAGHPYLVDAAAEMDIQESGLPTPPATIDALLSDTSSIWLIPAGQEPFMIVNWYDRYSGGLTFDDVFRSAFRNNFGRKSSTANFDLYERTTGTRKN